MAAFSLEAQSRALNTERAAKFCGLAKVLTSSLVFYPNFTPSNISSQPEKVERLRRIFHQEGCDRGNTNHCIPGDITAAALSAALDLSELSRDTLQNRADPPTLFLPQGAFIRCARGSSRVRAIEEFRPTDSWWTIELYVGKLDIPSAQDAICR